VKARRLAALGAAVLLAALLAAVARGETVPHGAPGKPQIRLFGHGSAPASMPQPSEATDGQWLSYGHDDQLTNAVTSTAIDRTTAPSLVVRWSAPLDGWMAASPVAASFGDTTIVVAATEGGSVDAFDAATGKQLWSEYVGVVSTPTCGDWGVSATPVVDPATDRVYVIGATGLLHAFDLATGDEADGYPLALTADRNEVEYVWGGLRLVGGTLYAGVASYCDAPDEEGLPAEGGIIAVDVATPAIAGIWDAVPGPDNLGGVWGYGGVSVEPDGSALYTGVGNATVTGPDGKPMDDAGYGDKIVRIDTATLQVTASNKPGDILTQGDDEDFGASPVLFQPDGCPPLAAMNNKQGFLYFWNRDAIDAGPLITLGLADGSFPFIGQPAWSPRSSTLYDAGTKGGDGQGGITAIRMEPGCKPRVVWRTAVGGGPQPPPIVVNDVVVAAGGTSGFTVLDEIDGSVLYHAATAAPALAPPIEVGGTIYASGGERLLAFSPAP
jgi:outer membrane protein assembly factor BamB